MKILNVLKTTIVASLVSSSLFAGVNATHWGYTGHGSPEHWSDLDPKYFMCKAGSNQSPINIVKDVIVTTSEGLEPISFNYTTTAKSVVNNGHTIQVNMKKGSYINIDGIKFDLLQFHFHTPSENQIDGQHFPLEAHFVHASKDGKLAVVAMMFEDGKENKFLKKIWSQMPNSSGNKNSCGDEPVTINDFLPKDRAYYRFDGSLTTPPCSEGVRWFVLQEYSTVNAAQVNKFKKLMHGHDNRPIQPINARKVLK